MENSLIQSRNKKKKPIAETIFIVLMLVYPILHFLIFWGIVNVSSIMRTFQKFIAIENGQIVNRWEFVWFENYKTVWKSLSDENMKRIISNSVGYMIVSNFISLPLAILSSYFLFKKMFMAKWFRVIFFLPSIIPIVVLATVFRFQFDPVYGPIDSLLKSMNITPPNWFGLYPNSQYMLYLYCLWAGLGFNVLLLSGAIGRLPVDLFEYSKLEGTPMMKEMFQIVIPLIWPTITTTFLLGLTSVFNVMLQPMMIMPNDAKTQTIAVRIYNSISNSDASSRVETITFGLLLSFLALPFILLARFAMEKIFADVEF